MAFFFGRALLAAFGTFLLSPALAQITRIAPSNIFTSLPGINNDKTAEANVYAPGKNGQVGLITLALEDQFDAVQIGFVNGTSGKWGIGQVVVAPSASYGPDPVIGAAAYDEDGALLDQMLPLQWSNGGAYSQPGIKADSLLSLPVADAVAAGQSSLPFASTVAAVAYHGASPKAGWAVADALGCIAAGTTVTRVDPTAIVLSRPVASGGCAAGQAIYFSAAAFGPFGQMISGADKGSGAGSLSFSDWMPIASLPRSDSGFLPGASVSGTGVSPGTQIAGTAYHALVLSKALEAAVPARTAIAVSETAITTAETPAGHAQIIVDGATGFLPGQTLGGSPAIAPHTHLTHVTGTHLEFDTPLVAALSKETVVTATGTVWTASAAQAGDTSLHVPSTDRLSLLHIRFSTIAGSPPSMHAPTCVPDPLADGLPCEQPLGTMPIWLSNGAPGVDGLNFVSAIGDGAGSPIPGDSYPSLFIRFRGAHAGGTMLICGGFQASGGSGSVSTEASFARMAAAAMTAANPGFPITAVNAASQDLDTDPDFANCRRWLTTITPGILMQQDYSNHNNATLSYYMPKVKALSSQALKQGTASVIYLGYPEASDLVGQLPVNGAVTNSTVIPLLTGLNGAVVVPTTTLQGPGVPPGTTVQSIRGAWSVTASRPLTLPAGTILNYGFITASESSGTTVTLQQPAFESQQTATPFTGTGVPAKDKIALEQGMSQATLSAAASIPAGSVLSVKVPVPAKGSEYDVAAQEYRSMVGQPWAAIQLDGEATLSTDPLHPQELCAGCTTQGSYANEYGNTLLSDAFLPILESLTGQSQTTAPAETAP